VFHALILPFCQFQTGTGMRAQLKSHTIVFAQEPFNVAESEFNDAYIKAALQNLHVEFVGPKGSKTRLEKAALEIDFLRLDPVRVYNGLVRLALVGLRRAPDLQQISNVLKATNYVQKIVQDGLDNLHEDVELDEAAENMFADPARVRGAWIAALSRPSAATVAVPSQLLPARSSTAATRVRLGCTARAASKVRHLLSVIDAAVASLYSYFSSHSQASTLHPALWRVMVNLLSCRVRVSFRIKGIRPVVLRSFFGFLSFVCRMCRRRGHQRCSG
jgi:hypothetical protein